MRGRKGKWKPREGDTLVEMLGDDGDWALWQRAQTIANGWHGFALQPPAHLCKTKSVFHGAWNGERLANNHDMQIFAEHHPDIYLELEKRCPMIEWEFTE